MAIFDNGRRIACTSPGNAMKSTGLTQVVFAALAAMTVLVSFASLNLSCLACRLHQPNTFSQMRVLVTPDDPEVREALSLARAIRVPNAEELSGNALTVSRIGDWIVSNISYVSDEEAHGVEDYWQKSAETLALAAGDCEDFAILMVSLLRASGVPEDEAYVAVGLNPNGEWHAWVVERYYGGIWRVITVEVAGEASYIDEAGGQPNVAYCFNDQQGFQGLPEYPPGYEVPELPPPPTVPSLIQIRIRGATLPPFEGPMHLNNPSFDDAKKRLGKFFLPSYIPAHYHLTGFHVSGNYLAYLIYSNNDGAYFSIWELPTGRSGTYPARDVEIVSVKGEKAYLVHGSYFYPATTATCTWREDIRVSLIFPLDGWAAEIVFMQPDSWSTEEMLKIAESIQAY